MRRRERVLSRKSAQVCHAAAILMKQGAARAIILRSTSDARLYVARSPCAPFTPTGAATMSLRFARRRAHVLSLLRPPQSVAVT